MPEQKLAVTLAAHDDMLAQAILDGGGELVPLGEATRALVWNRFHNTGALIDAFSEMPKLEWVQLPSAGIDDFVQAGALRPAYQWTSAKGAYAAPVAEHALTLTLAALRQIHVRARAGSWGKQAGKSLFGANIAIVGAGGIASEFIRLTAPFNVTVTVARKTAQPVEGAAKTIRSDQLLDILPDIDVLLLATPLTDETRGMIGARELAALRQDAVLVNVARGGLIRTDDLVDALANDVIAAAALDVTDPEPLPADHPLWKEPRALITPHTADTADMIRPLLAKRITDNIKSFIAGEPLTGVIDIHSGY